ncbi:MAG: YncE family protein [Anaerolineae bacterium]
MNGGALSPDGKTLYVTALASSYQATFLFIDTETLTITHALDVGTLAGEVELSSDGTRTYVLNRYSPNLIRVIDTVEPGIIHTVDFGRSEPSAMVATASRLYLSTGKVLVMDTSTYALSNINMGPEQPQNPQGIALAPHGKRLYVAYDDPAGECVGVIDTVNKILLQPRWYTPDYAAPADVAVSPGGSRVYMSDSREDRLLVFDASSGQIIATAHGAGDWVINTGNVEAFPAGAGPFVYVDYGGGKWIGVFNTNSNTFIKYIWLGGSNGRAMALFP